MAGAGSVQEREELVLGVGGGGRAGRGGGGEGDAGDGEERGDEHQAG